MEVRGQQAVDGEVIEGREQLAGGQVAGRAEDDHAGRLGAAMLAQAGKERMAVGVGHRGLGAAPPEEDFAAVLKEADGAFLANQNFRDVEARMTLDPDLTHPGRGGPPEGPLFAPVDGPVPRPAGLRRTRLHLDEDEDLAVEQDEVELVAPVGPVAREATGAASAIVGFGVPLAEAAQPVRGPARPPPGTHRLQEFGPKHVRGQPKDGVSASLRRRGS